MTDIVLNNDGFYELRTAASVKALLEQHGRRIAAAANATLREKRGYGMSSHLGQRRPQGRWRVTVYTDSLHAVRSNAKHHTLIRVMRG